MKFLVIATGGTIASVATPDGLRPGLTGENLVARVSLREGDMVDVIDLFAKDSTNMLPADWLKIAECVNGHADFFDAAIILHGTDTMAWTAAALSFLTTSTVVLTGSMLPAGVEDSDADKNLNAALGFARELARSGRKEVALAFNGKLYNGACVSKTDSSADDSFSSWNSPILGEFKDGAYTLNKFTPPKIKISDSDRKKIFEDISKNGIKKICLVPIFPGLKNSVLNALINEKPYAILLEGFGGGGVPFEGAEENLLPCIEKAVAQKIVVVLGTSSPFGGANPTEYEVGVLALRAGAVNAGKNTREALIVKLMFGLAV